MDRPLEEISIRPSDSVGWCELSLPLKDYVSVGYSLVYPANWTVRVAGAEAMNLLFNEGVEAGTSQEVFLQLAVTYLTLEQADQATYGFESSGPEPLLGPSETVTRRTIGTIGDKQVLVVRSSVEGFSLRRWFLLYRPQDAEEDYSTLYMFQVRTPTAISTTVEYAELLGILERMISSMQFAR
ncbi:MAG TPA: hypothetical protein VJK02_14985 [Anaerolineales bacterium]|nr:hypothetical protein [Anaerolineales bacterium]